MSTRRLVSFAGPTAALVALKCPFCLLALAGITSGVGSLMPVVQGAYWALILGLGALFIWSLFRSWKKRVLPGWVPLLGGVGFGLLIYQVATEAEGVMGYLPGIILVGASIASFAKERKASSSCSACETHEAKPDAFKGEEIVANKKRKVEVFTSGCPLCEPVVELVKKTACSSCEVIIYDLNAGCDTNECRDKAKQYGVARVPAVVVNGKLLDCCKTGTVSEKELRAAGVGSV